MSIETWGYTIKKLRESKDYTQQDLADKSGLSRSLIARIEQGSIITPTPDTINALAPIFDMRPAELSAFLYGDTTIPKTSDADFIFELDKRIKVLPIPIRGYINAGTPAPIVAIDLGVTWVEKDKISGVKKMDAVFALRISGDSLIGDRIDNGDNVVIDPNPDIIEGKIYAVKLQNEFVARHVHREGGYVVLTSSNGKYERMKVEEAEIVGRIIWSQPPGQSH